MSELISFRRGRWNRLVLLSLVLLSGCGKIRTCKPGTLLVSINLDAEAATADTFNITVVVNGQASHSTVPHSGAASGTLELDFAPGVSYPVGQSLSLMLEGTRNGQLVGQGAIDSLTLPPSCALVHVDVSMANQPEPDDLSNSGADMAGADMASTDMAMPPCGIPNSTRCNPLDHSKQQVCGMDGTWTDQPCGVTTSAPDNACTDLVGRCIDTGWAQWNYTSIPVTRFTTISDPTGNGNDIVKDAWTGLSWELKAPNSVVSWGQDAQAYCSGLSYGGLDDWRLPSPVELTTLLDLTVVNTGSCATSPPLVQTPFAAFTVSAFYWTSAPVVPAATSQAAWLVNFCDGGIRSTTNNSLGHVRCVR